MLFLNAPANRVTIFYVEQLRIVQEKKFLGINDW